MIDVGQPLAIPGGPAGAAGAAAPQGTGTPGSPSATTTILGNRLPQPAPKFGGVMKEGIEGSVAWWPPRVVPPEGAPNVLLIQIDDSGFATFTGTINKITFKPGPMEMTEE